MSKAKLLLCLAATALASCAVTAPGSSTAPKEKQVDVTIGPEWGWFGGKPVIKVDQETATVRAGTGAVVWALGATAADAGYKLGSDGIRFEFPVPNPPASCMRTPNPEEAFDLKNCGPLANGRLFVCPRKGEHLKGACYKYTVRLQAEPGVDKVAPLPVDPKDPWIISE